jgi:hypothetical protein
MKLIITVLSLFLFVSLKSNAQKEVVFKIKMLPDHSYASVMNINMNMEMNMTGDSSFMNKAKSAGQKFPVMMLMQSGVNTDLKTSAFNSKKEIPFVMKVQSKASKMTMSGTESIIPVPMTNQNYYGAFIEEKKARIDSISGNTIDEKGKAAIIKMMDGLQANIKFPEKPMKIGDTFHQDIPMELPIAGMSAKAISKTTYTLLSIANGKANFGMKYTIVMDMNAQQITMSMDGDGDGAFGYDLAANYPVNMLNNMNFNYTMVMPQDKNVKISGKVKMIMDNQTTIVAVK